MNLLIQIKSAFRNKNVIQNILLCLCVIIVMHLLYGVYRNKSAIIEGAKNKKLLRRSRRGRRGILSRRGTRGRRGRRSTRTISNNPIVKCSEMSLNKCNKQFKTYCKKTKKQNKSNWRKQCDIEKFNNHEKNCQKLYKNSCERLGVKTIDPVAVNNDGQYDVTDLLEMIRKQIDVINQRIKVFETFSERSKSIIITNHPESMRAQINEFNKEHSEHIGELREALDIMNESIISHKKIISTLNNTEEITNDQYNEFLNEITTVADAGESKFILDNPYFISEIERLKQLADSINNGCPAGSVKDDKGNCVCPGGKELTDENICECPAGFTEDDGGLCVNIVDTECPTGSVKDDKGNCVCPGGKELTDKNICECPTGFTEDDGGFCRVDIVDENQAIIDEITKSITNARQIGSFRTNGMNKYINELNNLRIKMDNEFNNYKELYDSIPEPKPDEISGDMGDNEDMYVTLKNDIDTEIKSLQLLKYTLNNDLEEITQIDSNVNDELSKDTLLEEKNLLDTTSEKINNTSTQILNIIDSILTIRIETYTSNLVNVFEEKINSLNQVIFDEVKGKIGELRNTINVRKNDGFISRQFLADYKTNIEENLNATSALFVKSDVRSEQSTKDMREKEADAATLNEEIKQLDSELANKDYVLNTYLSRIILININVTDESTIKSLNRESVLLDGINKEFIEIGSRVIEITNYIADIFDNRINDFIDKLDDFNKEL